MVGHSLTHCRPRSVDSGDPHTGQSLADSDATAKIATPESGDSPIPDAASAVHALGYVKSDMFGTIAVGGIWFLTPTMSKCCAIGL